MLANRVLMGSAVLVLVAMAFFQGAAAGAPLPAPVQARSSDRCSTPIRQQLGTVLPQMSVADEEKLCNDLEQPATDRAPTTNGTLAIYRDQWYRDEQTAMAPVPTTGGINNSCVAPIRQQLGTVLPQMSAADEGKLCNDLEQPATGSLPTPGGIDTTCVARVRQELGTAWPRMGSADEARLCSSFEKVADTVLTTGGVDSSCVVRLRQELGTAWPQMASAEEQKICKSFQ